MHYNPARELSAAEHGEITCPLGQALTAAGLDAVLATDSGNVGWLLGGRALPFVDQRPFHPVAVLRDGAAAVLVCPRDIEGAARRVGWTGTVQTYDGGLRGFGPALAAAIRHSGAARIGVDADAFPAALVAELNAGGAGLEADGGLLRRLRATKTEAEVRMLAFSARLADRAIVSALNHSEGSARDLLSYSLWEFLERIRVHVGEFGGSGTGHLAAMQGTKARVVHAAPDRHEALCPGKVLRAEWTSHHRGYWTSAGRTISIGAMPEALARAYAQNQQVKAAVVAALKPGVAASALCDVAAAEAGACGATLWEAPGLGHGVGTAEREWPHLVPQSDAELAQNMVLALAIYTRGPDAELIVDKDIYRITGDGAEKLSWYKDFGAMYEIDGTSARHG
jgi:Xaa-Pro aminopeptidase